MKKHLCKWLALALWASSVAVSAQERLTLVAPFPPGGPVDVLSRILAEGLQKKTGLTAVVENLPGAAGNLGIDKVKRAKPDGKTLLVVPAGNLTINPTLMPNFPFNIERDFVPVTMLAKAPNVLVASAQASAQIRLGSVRELVAQARAKPGTLSYASPGIGSGLHLAGELFKQQTDTDLLHVPYKGTGPALNDVLGGTVPLMFSNLPATLPHIKSGKLLALGRTGRQRCGGHFLVWPVGSGRHAACRGRTPGQGRGRDLGATGGARAAAGAGPERCHAKARRICGPHQGRNPDLGAHHQGPWHRGRMRS